MENSTALKNLAEYVTPGEITSAMNWSPDRARSYARAYGRSRPIAMPKGTFTSVPPRARISGAICTGIALRAAGTVRVMDLSSGPRDRC